MYFQKIRYGFRTQSLLIIMNREDQPQQQYDSLRINSSNIVSPEDDDNHEEEEEEESHNRDISIQAGDPAIKMVRFSLDKEQAEKKSTKMRPIVSLTTSYITEALIYDGPRDRQTDRRTFVTYRSFQTSPFN